MQLQSFMADVQGRTSWQTPQFGPPSRDSSGFSLSDASERFRSVTGSPRSFKVHRDSPLAQHERAFGLGASPNLADIVNRGLHERNNRETYNSINTFNSHWSERSPATFRDSKGDSIRYGEDESPQIGEAAFVEHPSSLLSPYRSFFGENAKFSSGLGSSQIANDGSLLSPGVISAGRGSAVSVFSNRYSPSGRLTPVSPRPLDLGRTASKLGTSEVLRDGPGRPVSQCLSPNTRQLGSMNAQDYFDAGLGGVSREQSDVSMGGMTDYGAEGQSRTREGTPGVAFL
jgi:hypothetical protein